MFENVGCVVGFVGGSSWAVTSSWESQQVRSWESQQVRVVEVEFALSCNQLAVPRRRQTKKSN